MDETNSTGLLVAGAGVAPVPGAWSVRSRGSSTAPVRFGAGDFTMDYVCPGPVPAAFPEPATNGATR